MPGFSLENGFANYVVDENGLNVSLIDQSTGENYCKQSPDSYFACVTRAGEQINASAVSMKDDLIRVCFGDGICAVIRAAAEKCYFTFEVTSFAGDGVDELTFANMLLTLKGLPGEAFACTTLALNINTNSPDIPGLNSRLQASCCSRLGFTGAKAAVVACPAAEIRTVLQEVVSAAPDVPHSPLGGPWAMDAEINRGSYLFNFDGITLDNVDRWIDLAQSLGMNQIDFHGGKTFRFGDCRFNPDLYPNGRSDMKAVIDRLHAAGIKAGLHTYAFFLEKTCPWVTPVPDHRLGYDRVLTLSEDIAADSSVVRVKESTEGMSLITGFFERNSVTIRIDDELITYSGLSKSGFANCERGACGTTPAPHANGAKAYHLTECFGLFAPGGDTDLLAEVAAVTAETFNECGFDMMYLDALDGEDILGGSDYTWHYGSKFAYELCRILDKPALIEMSTFRHHLWCVRSRIGAMDYPARSQKRFIDIHCEGNEHVVHCKGNVDAAKMFLPAQLGWWSLHLGGDPQIERTFPDDIEYLMCKGMATNTGFALMGIDPDTASSAPALGRLAPVFRQYENLRHQGYFTESTRKSLGMPGYEYHLEQTDGEWSLRPIEYQRHKVERLDGISNKWQINNKFGPQPLQLRIEALMSAAPYDSPDGVVISDSANFPISNITPGITACLQSVSLDDHGCSVKFTAANSGAPQDSSWAGYVKEFSPYLDLSKQQGLGVWVHGDGQGQLLNIQLRSPEHHAWGVGDHYVLVDFTGWRYFELVEPEAERVHQYAWPYNNDLYGIYREKVDFACIGKLGFWYNGLPPGKQVECRISPIKALPLVSCTLVNPRITIAGKTMTFPVELESGCYLEFRSIEECAVCGPKGELVCKVKPEGDMIGLQPGANEAVFECETPAHVSARAYLTAISQSERTIR